MARTKTSPDTRPLTIAVTGLNAIDSPGPGMAVIRALREGLPDRKLRILGLSYEALEPGIYMPDWVDKTYSVPYPSAGTDALLTRFAEIHHRDPIDLVIPNFDAELFNFIKLGDKLREMGIATFLPTLEQLDSREKVNLFAFAEKHGMLAPRDRVIASIDVLPGIAHEFGWPLVVKGKFYDATVCYTLEQAQKAFQKLQAKWGLPIIVQEFIAGTEVNVAALGDGTGRTISAVPMRKLYITDKGKAWAGITIEDESLVKLAEKFIAVTQWKGGFELEIMRAQDGRPFIMEINPRFPAWIYLTAGANQNQPAALAKMALGEDVEPYQDYALGKMFIRYSWDLIVDVEQFQRISAFGELAGGSA